MKDRDHRFLIILMGFMLPIAILTVGSGPATAQGPDQAGLEGQVYLQGRGSGGWGGTLVALQESGGGTYLTTTTDANGGFAFNQVPSGTYTAHFTHTLFVPGVREGISLSPGVTSTLPLVGLWAGDLDGDGDVDPADWLACAVASLAGSQPPHDLNGDGVTDVRDCTRVLGNIGRPDMPGTNPPGLGLGF
jgi:hypothetical protein